MYHIVTSCSRVGHGEPQLGDHRVRGQGGAPHSHELEGVGTCSLVLGFSRKLLPAESRTEEALRVVRRLPEAAASILPTQIDFTSQLIAAKF